MKKLPCTLALMGLMAAAPAVSDTVLNVGATGANRDAAIEQALGDAMVSALGAQVFSVSTMTGDQFTQMSTAVTAGRVSNYDILEEWETPEGIHVRLQVTLSDENLADLAPVGVEAWSDRIAKTHSMDLAQRTVRDYRRSLNEFLIGPRHQLEAGYSFVLRSYDIESVGGSRLKGNFYVDVLVNEPWWDTYYRLVDAMKPQGEVTILEGPIVTGNQSAHVVPERSSSVDASLQYDLAHPLPVRIRVGDDETQFILYKNALLNNAMPMALEAAQNAQDESLASRGGIVFKRGNVPVGTAVLNRQLSDLNCGTAIHRGGAVYCGRRFSVAIPFEAANESEVIRVARQGVAVEMMLFAQAKHPNEAATNDESGEDEAFEELLKHIRPRN